MRSLTLTELVVSSIKLDPQLWGRWLVRVKCVFDFGVVVNGVCKHKDGVILMRKLVSQPVAWYRGGGFLL